MSQLLRSAIALGATPLIFGSLIYWTWRLTRWSFLEMMGLMTLLIGFIAFLIAATCLILYLRNETRSGVTPQRTLIVRALLVGGLLVLNFPTAAFYTGSAIKIYTQYTVEISNDSQQPIERLTITGPGITVNLDPIPPGKTLKQYLQFKGDGPLEFSGSQNEIEFSGTLDPYVTGNLGGHKILRVKSKGLCEIIAKDR
jgi:hypothetical protein